MKFVNCYEIAAAVFFCGVNMLSVDEAYDQFKSISENIGGCTDGLCLVKGHAKGMHTNGTCHCYERRLVAQRMMYAGIELFEALKRERELNDNH